MSKSSRWLTLAALVIALGAPAAALPGSASGSEIRLGSNPVWTTPFLLIGKERGAFDAPPAQVKWVTFVNPNQVMEAMAASELDAGAMTPAHYLIALDKGLKLTAVALLSGWNTPTSSYMVRVDSGIQTVQDLRGKTVGVNNYGGVFDIYLRHMLDRNGMDPKKDVNFVAYPPDEAKKLLAEGKVDAYLGFPPDPQELRDKKIGHVVVNSAVDRPWSQYFCCFVTASKEFVRKHPVATKRAVRAILKATDLCAFEPDRAARTLVAKGFTQRYDYALQTMKDVVYNKWRVYDPEDTLRFYALRLHEAGMIKSTPQKLIAHGTDWRFLNELKKELKG